MLKIHGYWRSQRGVAGSAEMLDSSGPMIVELKTESDAGPLSASSTRIIRYHGDSAPLYGQDSITN
jgi:hypothetical protein